MNILAVTVVIFVCLATWVWRTQNLIKRKGFDPSLVTYADPLNFYGFWLYRTLTLAMAVLLTFKFSSGARDYLALIALVCAGLHLLILTIFERLPTQPVDYYLGVVAISIFCMLGSKSAVLAIFVGQELLLLHWAHVSKQRYNKWVSRKARRISSNYRELASSMPPSNWRFVLHVAVTEDIARPKIVRLAEALYFKLKRPAYISTGIMQIRASRVLSDAESMRDGAKIIQQALRNMPANLPFEQKLHRLATNYNGSGSYSRYLKATSAGIDQFFESTRQ